ncbi:MAG: PilT/PilU family type 4a pilus ATPase [Lysobacterales bacterium]|nr:MAG: PilT/PilU family type 4a pilus ATPase [Xanthomonadales bacterium]
MVVSRNCSDIHFHVGRPPTVRLDGRVRSLDMPSLKTADTEAILRQITPERCLHEVEEKGGADFAFTFENGARFRTAGYRQRGEVSCVLRLLPNEMKSFEQIGLPMSIKNLLLKPRGLVLVTGPTGSGKTTTLATMIDFINTEQDRHIITIEDPIEYYHQHKKSIISQREVGVDVRSFGEATRRALRQDPDVILVGEMRDLETMEAAISAAETGHLVFATLHTTGAAKTVNRIIDAFPMQQQEQIRTQLSTGLLAVISQELLARIGGGRVAAFEIMVLTPSISHLIRENQVHKVNSDIQTGKRHGMVLLDDFLLELYRTGQADFSEVMKRAQDPGTLQEKIKQAMPDA